MFKSQWEAISNDSKPAFESDVYEAIAAGNKCAIARKDKTAIGTFKTITAKVTRGNGDPRDRLTAQEQSFIRIWYLRSLEN